jgi:hypothetical protein
MIKKKKYIIKSSKKPASEGNLLNTKEAAEYLGLKQKQLENFRGQKRGPEYTKIGLICYYDKQALGQWQESRKNIKIPKQLVADSLKDKKKLNINQTSSNRINVKSNKLDQAVKKFKSSTGSVVYTNQIKTLLDAKKGFFVNKTYVNIFKNIMSALISLDEEVKRLKKKVK